MKEIHGASIILTEGCNLSCSYCYEKKKSPSNMDSNTVTKAVDFVFDHSNDTKKLSFIWFGGEPLTQFNNLTHGYTYAKKKAETVGKTLDNLIITNGTIWNEMIEEFFRKHPDIRLQLSWDGMPEFQDKERGMSDVVEETLARMVTLPNSLHAHLQITPNMVPKLAENIDYIIAKMGNKANVVLRPIAEIEDWDNEALLSTFREQLFIAFSKHENKIDKIATCDQQVASLGTCGAGKNFATITPDGDLYACHRFYFNKNRDFKVGTLDDGFITTAKTDLLEEYTKDNIIGCIECNAYEMCDRCIAANFSESFDALMPTDSNCKVYLSQFYAVFNYMKVKRPWTTTYQPKPILRIAAIPKEADLNEFIVDNILPMIYELQSKTDWLEDQNQKLSAKVEYYENSRRTQKRPSVHN
ncbi:MAG: 4Fe-4S cluster-binding domain-containing protein [Negativicutes bacterium]|nr:4Fe-4S cluster-binding domain-containing protein [Negativicutes bacterium]